MYVGFAVPSGRGYQTGKFVTHKSIIFEERPMKHALVATAWRQTAETEGKPRVE